MIWWGRTSVSMFLLAVLTFLVPASLIVYELWTVFPVQSWSYTRIKNAFGKVHWFASWRLSRLPILLLMPLVTTAIAKHIEYLFWATFSNVQILILQIILIFVASLIAFLHINKTKKVISTLFLWSVATAIIALLVWIFFWSHPNNFELSQLVPDFTNYWYVYSAAILRLLGVEDPFNMWWEVKDLKHSAKKMLTRWNLILVLAYLFWMIAILLISEPWKVDPIIWLSQSVWTVFPILWKLVSILIIWAVFWQLITYFTEYSRLLVTFAEEWIFHHKIAKQNSKEVPVVAIWLQMVLSIIIVSIFTIFNTLTVAFNLILAWLVVVWCFSLYHMYIALPVIRKKYHNLYEENVNTIRKIPWWNIVMYFVVGVAIVFNTVSIYYVFKSPRTSWITKWSRRLWLLIISAIIILSSFIVYQISKSKKNSKLE